MSKLLVSYFSASGRTKTVAEKIAGLVGADLFEIEPEQKYTDADLNWSDKQSRTSIEMKDTTCRPKISKKVENMGEYDTVIIGFPIWWYIAPKIINTFLEENDLTGKNIYIFVTSGGSTVTDTFQNLQREYPNLRFIKAQRFTGKESEDVYKSWLS